MRPTISLRRRGLAVTGAAMAGALLVAGCGGGNGTSGSTSSVSNVDEGSSFVVLSANENPAFRTHLDNLAKNQCAAENTALPLKHETVAQADVVQKVTLLASQGALPSHFVAGTAQVRPTGDLGKAKVLLNYKDALTKAGVWDQVLPAAASTVEKVYGDDVSLPYQYNIEGIWYNKKILADNGISEPKTWTDLVAAMDKLKAAGVIPMTQGGAAGWPLTRLIGMYIFRNVGPDAMADVQNGKAKLTDAAYVAGAQALADLGAKGYFGEGVSSRAADQATSQFLTGKAAMTYNGSWFLSNVNDAKANTIGADNVGFMAFPTVSGGKGTTAQWPSNAGTVTATSVKTYGPKSEAWLSCIVKNYGAEALKTSGSLSGLKVNETVAGVPATTQMIQTTMSSAKESVLWFEALMDSKSSALASTNVSLLVTGQMTPADYMQKLQSSIEANK